MKRAFDFAGALALTVVLAPLLAVIAIAIVLDAPGPVFTREERIGVRGRRFCLRTFRTTTRESTGTLPPPRKGELTQVGRWLRRWQLDELPQLFNVLAGEMSLVGPPPQIPEVWEAARSQGGADLAERPGLTGPALLRAAEGSLTAAGLLRQSIPAPTRAAPPLHGRDAREHSIRGDTRLLIRTLQLAFAVLARRIALKGEERGRDER